MKKDRVAALESPVEALEQMLLVRRFEERLRGLATTGELKGTVLHSSVGQEAGPVALRSLRRDGDLLLTTHRGNGHCIQWGVGMVPLLAECIGRVGGLARGRAGHMHLYDPENGMIGTNGIVGGNLSQAVGAAYALSLNSPGNVVFCFLGDGATNTGSFHESLNLAQVWRVPVLYVCEDNLFAETTVTATVSAGSITGRAASYGIATQLADGSDLASVYDAMAELCEVARGGQPALLHCRTFRAHGHYIGDPEHYREEGDAERAADEDPIASWSLHHELVGEPVEAAITRVDAELDRVFEEVLVMARTEERDVWWEAGNG